MPTGYTDLIAQKENCTIEEYAMRCARNFGALIEMRDAPMDAPIPERFEPNPFYKKELEDAQDRLDSFMKMTVVEKREFLEDTYHKMVEHNEKQKQIEDAKRSILRNRYNFMLEKINKWKPPTPEHVNLRNFMIQQVQDSIEWDCDEYEIETLSFTECIDIQKHIEYLKKDVDFHKNLYQEELKRIEDRNKWLSDLRESLKDLD